MYNLIEYSKNYRKTTGSLWNYYRDELSDDTKNNNDLNKNLINSESFKYKTNIRKKELLMQKVIKSIILIMMQINLVKKVDIVVPSKYLSNFWRSLDMPLINCEVSLTLTWSENCVITSLERREMTNTRRDSSPTNATFKITVTKLYVPVVTYQQKMIIIF